MLLHRIGESSHIFLFHYFFFLPIVASLSFVRFADGLISTKGEGYNRPTFLCIEEKPYAKNSRKHKCKETQGDSYFMENNNYSPNFACEMGFLLGLLRKYLMISGFAAVVECSLD